ETGGKGLWLDGSRGATCYSRVNGTRKEQRDHGNSAAGKLPESFSEFEKVAAGHDLPWLRKLRRDAFARFFEVGFPTTHDEDWRFTSVSAIAHTPFRLTRNGRARLSQQELEPYRVPGVACQLVFVNGCFAR